MGFVQDIFGGGTQSYDPYAWSRPYMRQLLGRPWAGQPGPAWQTWMSALERTQSPEAFADWMGYGSEQIERQFAPQRERGYAELVRRGGGTAPSWAGDYLASMRGQQARSLADLYAQGRLQQQQAGLQAAQAPWAALQGAPTQMMQGSNWLGNLMNIGMMFGGGGGFGTKAAALPRRPRVSYGAQPTSWYGQPPAMNWATLGGR